MEYFLMRKNEVVTLCDIDSKGNMLAYSENYRNQEIAPLAFRAYGDHIQRWWKARRIPIRQVRAADMLRHKGIDEPSEYLLNNLGLSLTDYYWMRPISSSLSWEDVNLFDNDFRDNIMQPAANDGINSSSGLTPNSSLKGELEKTWLIKDGKRILVKGNHGCLSEESINEVIASEFHKAQGFKNYTGYSLIHIKDKPYDYGCCSEAFTNNKYELVSAYDLLTSESKDKDGSEYERLIKIASIHGADAEQLRADLEYQILSDYILSNTDRHMDNIGFLRDAESLKLIRMAPIFDTGRAFVSGSVTPYTDDEIDSIEVNSFEHDEASLLKLVTDMERIDLSALLPEQRIRDLYKKDTKMRPAQIDMIIRLYKKKIERTEKTKR